MTYENWKRELPDHASKKIFVDELGLVYVPLSYQEIQSVLQVDSRTGKPLTDYTIKKIIGTLVEKGLLIQGKKHYYHGKAHNTYHACNPNPDKYFYWIVWKFPIMKDLSTGEVIEPLFEETSDKFYDIMFRGEIDD